MRKILCALALAACCVPTAACQTIKTADQALSLANENVGDFTTADEKGWYYAEALYNVPAQAYLSANSRGLLKGPLKAQLKGYLITLNEYRGAVYQAYKAGNSVTFREKLIAMKSLSDQIRNLIPQ